MANHHPVTWVTTHRHLAEAQFQKPAPNPQKAKKVARPTQAVWSPIQHNKRLENPNIFKERITFETVVRFFVSSWSLSIPHLAAVNHNS